MFQWLVPVTHTGLLALVLFLGYRMLRLARTELISGGAGICPFDRLLRTNLCRLSSQPTDLRDRSDLFTKLHILAGLQERECRENGLNLAEAPDLIVEHTSAWLLGAGCALCAQSDRLSDPLIGLVAQVVSRKTGAPQGKVILAIHSITSNAVSLNCYRRGLEGAEHWHKHHFVPRQFSLHDAIASNTFI